MKTLHLNSLHQEYKVIKIQDRLQSYEFEKIIKNIELKSPHLCFLGMQAACYSKDFTKKMIPTKARPAQMSKELVEYYTKEINDLLHEKLIRETQSLWSCTAFYVNKNAELEKGVPSLVINCKPLNKALQWIRYPIPNKKDLLKHLNEEVIFSKFDLKLGFWQIQVAEADKYKTTFTVPFGQYKWNVIPFGLTNAPSAFQKIMNDIYSLLTCILSLFILMIF